MFYNQVLVRLRSLDCFHLKLVQNRGDKQLRNAIQYFDQIILYAFINTICAVSNIYINILQLKLNFSKCVHLG